MRTLNSYTCFSGSKNVYAGLLKTSLLCFTMLLECTSESFSQALTLSQSSCSGTARTLTATTNNSFFLDWQIQGGGTNGISSPFTTVTRVNTGSIPQTYVARALSQNGINLVTNGDFEAGRTGCPSCTGFTSDYPYTTNVSSNSKYGISQNPESDEGYFQPLKDHTYGDGTGWMYYSDGGSDPNKYVYKTTVSVIKDSHYVFSVWAANIHDNLAKPGWDTTGNVQKSTNLEFAIDGVVQGRILLPVDTKWHQFYTIYTATSTGSINISIKNRETALKGNDFALDDIGFYKASEITSAIVVQPCMNATVTPVGIKCNSTSTAGSIAITDAIGGGGTYEYSIDGGKTWNGGPGNSYIFTGLSAGTYDVRIRDKETPSYYVVLNPLVVITQEENLPPPVIHASGPVSFCQGGSVLLTAQTTGAGTLQWFKDGTAIPGASAIDYTATASGEYLVKVTTSPECPSAASDITKVVLNPIPPKPVITADGPVRFCSGGSVQLTSSSEGAGSYQWYINNQAIAGATSVTYITTGDGDYSVVVRSAYGCNSPASDVTKVTVDPTPIPPTVTAGGPVTFCEAGSVLLSATASMPGRFQWFKNGGPIASETGVSYVATTNGEYSVVLTNDQNCSSASSAITKITIHPTPPKPVISVNGPLRFCSGGSVLLTSSTEGAGAYRWYFQGVEVAGAINNTYDASATGDYTVVITSPEGCISSASDFIHVDVDPTPTSPTVTLGGPAVFCDGGFVVLTASSPDGGIYQWFRDGSSITGANDVAFVATESGHYSVGVTNSFNCSSPASSAVEVNAVAVPPQPVVIAQGPLIFCEEGNVVLSCASSRGTSTVYQWYKDGIVITGETHSTYKATSSGNYSVIVSRSGNCASPESAVTAVVVHEMPVLSASASRSSLCAGEMLELRSSATGGSGTFKYHWSALSGGLDKDGQNVSLPAPKTTTDYRVVIQDASTVSASCRDTAYVSINILSPVINAGGLLAVCTGSPDLAVPATIRNATAPVYTWTMVSGGRNLLKSSNVLNPEIGVPPGGIQSDTLKYLLTVQDNGCMVSDTFTMVIHAIPSVKLVAADTFVCAQSGVELQAEVINQTSGNYTYHWLKAADPGSGSANDSLGKLITPSSSCSFTAPTVPGSNLFYLTLTDGHGCQAGSDTVSVNASLKQDLIVPNLITPNGDLHNECLIIKDIYNKDILPGAVMEVFNRWGERIYRDNSYSNETPWCGGSHPDGIYYYLIRTGCEEHDIKGWLQIAK